MRVQQKGGAKVKGRFGAAGAVRTLKECAPRPCRSYPWQGGGFGRPARPRRVVAPHRAAGFEPGEGVDKRHGFADAEALHEAAAQPASARPPVPVFRRLPPAPPAPCCAQARRSRRPSPVVPHPRSMPMTKDRSILMRRTPKRRIDMSEACPTPKSSRSRPMPWLRRAESVARIASSRASAATDSSTSMISRSGSIPAASRSHATCSAKSGLRSSVRRR
jgi:hypothetical protein